MVKESLPVRWNKSAAPPFPCRCCRCRHAGGVLLPPIYGLGSGLAFFSVGGSGGWRSDFAPRGSVNSASSWLLWPVGEAASMTGLCEYCLTLPLHCCAVEFPFDGAGVGSWCVRGVGSPEFGEDSTSMAVFPVCCFFMAEVCRFPDRHGRFHKVAGSGRGVAAMAARLQLALVRVVLGVCSEDLVVILFTFGVLRTTSKSSI